MTMKLNASNHLIWLVLLLFSKNTFAHIGSTDTNGGHADQQTGYHCHKEPCFSGRLQQMPANNVKQLANDKFNIANWPHWVDYNGDCQHQNDELLIVSSKIPVTFNSDSACKVSHGEWIDPYNGETYQDASTVIIDHIVPTQEAHVSGAQSWSLEQRRAFANDPDNMIPVSRLSKQQKGVSDPAGWLPMDVSYRCEYIMRWLYIKRLYQLSIDGKEQQAIDEVMANCP